MGVPSAVVEKLTTSQLADAYNHPGILDNLRQADEPKRPRPSSASLDQAALGEVIAKAIGSALAAMPSQLDESRVVELIREHGVTPSVSVIEVRDREGVIERVEGLHHKQTPEVLAWLSASVNVWLAGPAGSGKTTLAKTCAKALGLAFYATGAVQNEYKLTGFVDAEGRTVRTSFREAFEHGGLFLWDEIDASNANALVAFNQALANGEFAFPDGMVVKHADFVAVAAANTFGNGATAEYVGRNRIDGATLDRFAQVFLDYDTDLEVAIAQGLHERGREWAYHVISYRKAAAELGLRHIISPRASIEGAKALGSGLTTEQITNALIRRGLDTATWEKLEARA